MPETAGKALVDTLRHPELLRKASTHLSGGLRAVRDSSALQHAALQKIPALKWISMAQNGMRSYRDYILTQKIVRFFDKLHSIPEKDREAFIQEIDQDQNERERVGEKIFLLLDRHDEMEKSSLLGLAYRDYIEKKITRDQLERLGRAIDRVYLPHIYKISSVDIGSSYRYLDEAIAITDLLQAGLIYPSSVRDQLLGQFESHPSQEYHPTDISDIIFALYDELRKKPRA